MTKVDVRVLAQLARLEVTEEELARLETEIPNILAFVEMIRAASASSSSEPMKAPGLRNVMRSDEDPHESEMYTETLLESAPVREGNRIAVKQVISRKK